MISLTHTQIAQYLKDYSRLTAYMIEPENQMIKPFTIFKRKIYNINNTDKLNEKDYYTRMMRIAYLYTKMKMFSIAEDYTLKQKNNFINNDDLDLSFLNGKITGNTGSISNKKLLQMLRDGFNHSSSDNEIYKVARNAKRVEFTFDLANPITVNLSLGDISSLTSAISDAAQTFQFFSFEEPDATNLVEYLDKLKIKKHCFPKKVPKTDISSVIEFQNQDKYDDAISLVKTFNQAIEKDITLTDKQKENILNILNELVKGNVISIDEVKKYYRDIIIILLNKELPIPVLKLNNYLLDSYFQAELLKDGEFPYAMMYHVFLKALEDSIDSPIAQYKDHFDKFKQLVLKTYYSNECEKLAYSYLLFIEYVLVNFKPDDDVINIGGTNVEYNKLRNSIVHGRWHVDKENIMFYDAFPNAENELEYNWSAKLNLAALYNYCNNILNEKLVDEKPKVYTK